jgi:hypothetical protein
MKRVSITLAALAMLAANPACAAPSIDLTLPNATFGNSSVFCSTGSLCTFTDTITFTTPHPYNLVSATITTIAVGGVGSTSDINLTSATLNGVAFSLSRLMGGIFEIGAMSETGFLPLGAHTLVISGISYGTNAGLDGTYSGTLTFASNLAAQTAIPEPATWTSLIFGLAAIGHAQRKRPALDRRAKI